MSRADTWTLLTADRGDTTLSKANAFFFTLPSFSLLSGLTLFPAAFLPGRTKLHVLLKNLWEVNAGLIKFVPASDSDWIFHTVNPLGPLYTRGRAINTLCTSEAPSGVSSIDSRNMQTSRALEIYSRNRFYSNAAEPRRAGTTFAIT